MSEFKGHLKWRAKRTSDQARDHKAILRSCRPLVQQLKTKRNVCFVTVGRKQIDGVLTDTIALKVYVTQKGDVAEEHRIPETMTLNDKKSRARRLRTDVVALPSAPIALGARAGELIAVENMTKGMCCLALIKNGQGYLATCAHVVENILQHHLFRTAIQQPITGQMFALADTVYSSPFPPGVPTDEDFAIIRAGSVPVDHLCILNEPYPIAQFGDFYENLTEPYWYNVNGSRIGCGHPEPSPPNSPIPILIDGVQYPYRNFWRLQVMTGLPAPGHSGSIVCRGEGQNITACGILFGASPPSFAYVYPLNPVLYDAVNKL